MEGWEAEKAKLEATVREKEQAISGLSAERNSYRQRFEAYDKLAKQAPEIYTYDPVTGLPTGWNELENSSAPASAPAALPSGNPFVGLVDNPQAVDGYFQTLVQQHVNQHGYITHAKAEELMNTAMQQGYQLARGDAMLWRTYDRLVTQEKDLPDGKKVKPYLDLANPESELYKRTVRLGQERKLLAPLDPAVKTLDSWRWANLEALQLSADLARMELSEEAQHAAASAVNAGNAAGAAALSVGATGTVTSPPSGGVPLNPDGSVNYEQVRTDTKQRMDQAGVTI